jgi:hypothetical protein
MLSNEEPEEDTTVSDPGSPNGTDPTTAEVELDVLEGGAVDEDRDDDTA